MFKYVFVVNCFEEDAICSGHYAKGIHTARVCVTAIAEYINEIK